MNVHVSYKISKSPDLEHTINLQIQKLGKRLQVFRPELVHLKALIEEKPARAGVEVRLDLRLPSGDIAARETAENVDGAIRGAFDDLNEQLAKHKDRLRAQHQWPNRRRAGKPRTVEQVPFEETVAAVHPPTASEEDISTWVNTNLLRWKRFVERELRYREANGELKSHELRSDEVIDEAIANALGKEEKPEKITLEPWLYRLSLRAIAALSHHNGDEVSAVSLEQPAREGEYRATGSDETFMQFHQPDESVTQENLIPNRGISSPEDTAAQGEMITYIERALDGTKREDREAFLLFTIEGFTVDEISVISSRNADEVRASVKRAREHLRTSLPVPSHIKDKLLQHSKIA